METPTQLWCYALLRRSNSAGSKSRISVAVLEFIFGRQIGIVNAAQARRVDRPVIAIIAGSAPTAHLIEELEAKSMRPVHVYGLT